MPQASGNTLTPQKGLVSTNPFLTNTNLSNGGGANTIVSGIKTTSPSGISTTLGSPKTAVGTSPLISPSVANSGGTPTNGSVYSFNGTTYGAGGDPLVGTNNGVLPPPNTGGTGGNSGTGTTQNSGTNNTGANTYSGGVNANGQTFPGYVSTLENTATGTNQNYQGNLNTSGQAQTGLINSIPANSAAVQSATQNLQALQNNYANQTGIIGNSPIGLSEQGGEQGLLNNQYASKLGAAQTAVSNALQGNAQVQNAYNEAGGLANTAAGAATNEQQTQQSGQGTAAGLIAPTPANALGQYNPASGLVTGYNTGSGMGSGAFSAGGVSNEVNLGQQASTLTATQNQARNITSQLQQTLSQNPDINPSQFSVVNGLLQAGANQIGNPAYQTFSNQINDLISRYSQILTPSGGNVTDLRTQIAQSLINAQANGKSIMQVLQSLDQQASGVISGLNTGGATSNGTNTGSNTSGYQPFFSTQ